MAARNEHPTGPQQAELTLTRIFDAPRELVFDVWTDPKHLAQWWGPEMFTTPVCRVDARPGGELYIVMHGPDGQDYPMKGVFEEVRRPERLSFTNQAMDGSGVVLLEGKTAVSFEALGSKTRVTVHTVMRAKVPQAAFALAGMEPGWNQTLDRLGTYVGAAA
ncbi:MAG TPA: SRPBCC domain-containing protein [Gammaproteobacteria bacterium]|nr:SRPBCC domain-containing protein [Gammaproteobacteria bacterium]